MGPKMVPRRHFFAACWRSVLSSSEVNKTLHWLTKIEVRPSFDRSKKRRNFDPEAVRTRFCLPNALGPHAGVVWMARGGSPDGPRGDLGPTWARPGRPRALLGRPRRVPDRSWTPSPASAERPRAPRSAQRSNFRVFSSFWDRFWSIRTRFSIDFASKKASSNTGRRCPQTHCSKSPRSTSLRCDHASAPSIYIYIYISIRRFR